MLVAVNNQQVKLPAEEVTLIHSSTSQYGVLFFKQQIDMGISRDSKHFRVSVLGEKCFGKEQ